MGLATYLYRIMGDLLVTGCVYGVATYLYRIIDTLLVMWSIPHQPHLLARTLNSTRFSLAASERSVQFKKSGNMKQTNSHLDLRWIRSHIHHADQHVCLTLCYRGSLRSRRTQKLVPDLHMMPKFETLYLRTKRTSGDDI